MTDSDPPFDVADIDLATLRQRQSAKYRQYPADVIPAWVAEMDFPLAEPIAAAKPAYTPPKRMPVVNTTAVPK